jgi:hypothetical protein
VRRAFRILLDTLLVLGLSWAVLAALAWGYDFVALRRASNSGNGAPRSRRPSDTLAGRSVSRAVKTNKVLPVQRSTPQRHGEIEAEAGHLAAAMCDWMTDHGTSTDECERRELGGLAAAIVETVAEESNAGRWVPLSRTKAPALLAAWSFHEVSWFWRRPPVGRSHHEVGAFQFHGVALNFVDPGFETDPVKSIRGAIHYMRYLRGLCHADRPLAWGGAYISGECDGVPDEVGRRISQARWLLRRMSRTAP